LKEKASSSWFFTNNKRIIDFAVYLFNSNLCWENRRFRRSRFLYWFYTAEFLCWNHFYCNEYDYFPRLSSISDDNVKVRASVIQQSFISILIITPIVILFLTFITVIVKVIYTLNLFLLYRWFVSF
jgi:hypothetical protein